MNRIISKKRNKYIVYAIMTVLMIALIAVTGTAVHAAANQTKISVTQSFSTTSASAGDVFTYMFRPVDAGAPMPAGSIAGGYAFSIAGNRSVEFGPIAFSREGVFRYEVYQTTVALSPGYSYDWRSYTVEMHVDENLRATVIAYNNRGGKVNGIVFENSYKVQPTDPRLMTDPPVVKTVTGRPGRSGTFTFKLAAYNASSPMPSGSVNGIKTLHITGAGSGEFGTWSYDRAGVYYYTVYEENTGERGYTYDTSVYSITDTVTEANGQLVLSRVVTNNINKPVSSYEFNNRYSFIDDVLGSGPVYRETENPFNNIGDGGNPYGSGPVVPVGDITDGGNPGSGADIPDQGGSTPGKPGAGGPKTGDDTNTVLYIALFAGGGILVAGALLLLIVAGKRKKAAQRA